ncbi:MAG: hypothetical protein AB1597_02790 [Chloroflexota bacterium]
MDRRNKCGRGRVTALGSLVLVALLLFIVWHVVVVDRDSGALIPASNTTPSLDCQWVLPWQAVAFNGLDGRRNSGDFLRETLPGPTIALLLATVALSGWSRKHTTSIFSVRLQAGSPPGLVLRL